MFSSLGRDFGLGGSTLEMTGSLGVGVELILRISSFESREMEPGQVVPEKDAEKVAEKVPEKAAEKVPEKQEGVLNTLAGAVN